MLTASEKLAVELVVLPFPFVGRERAAIEAEYTGLLAENVKPGEIADVVLFALEILINKKNQTKDPNTCDRITAEISDMLGRLAILEQMFSNKRIIKLQ
ncbi:MAG TPA: hypothetical protein VMW91_00875 [Desulfosporosinus sp.]|jgi:hypothetical protein|nr:hypothetical protein [Desulfosporosinus sp.]